MMTSCCRIHGRAHDDPHAGAVDPVGGLERRVGGNGSLVGSSRWRRQSGCRLRPHLRRPRTGAPGNGAGHVGRNAFGVPDAAMPVTSRKLPMLIAAPALALLCPQ